MDSFDDDSKQAQLTGFCYKPLLQAELRRHPWRFATRRAVLRAATTQSLRISPPLWDQNSVVYSIGSLVRDENANYWMCICPHTSAPIDSLMPGFPFSGVQDVFWKEWCGPIVGNPYDAALTYYKGEIAFSGSDWYVSIANNNLANSVGNVSFWTRLPNASGIPAFYFADIGQGVTVSGLAQNIFPLPVNYLRMTYAGVKAPSAAHNVISGGLQFNDWQIEDDFIVSSSAGPLHIRCIADVDAVLFFEPLFSEALAARIAYEICEPMTQSAQKQQLIAQAYQQFIDEAQQTNLIETASTEARDSRFDMELNVASVPATNKTAAPQPGGR